MAFEAFALSACSRSYARYGMRDNVLLQYMGSLVVGSHVKAHYVV